MAITFQNNDIEFKLFEKTKIKQWIKKIIELENKKLKQLNFVFTTDKEILKTNIQFLNHTTYTDIITFDDCVNNFIIGDIIISVERVKDNALKYKIDFDIELRRVIIHGVLHLCGYKDKSSRDIKLMRAKENWALQEFKFNIKRPTSPPQPSL